MGEKLTLHIGPPKTGTSAIQKWCMENQAALAELGIYYPHHATGAHHISSGHADLLLERNEAGKYEFDRAKFEATLASFKASGCATLLLSSEYFFYFVPEIIERFEHFKVVAYVRSPIAQLESAYNQTVKRHAQISPFRTTKNLHLTTLNRLEDILERLHTSQFDIRAYLESESFDVVADFIDSIGVNLNACGNTVNPSYTYEALECKRWLNQFELGALDHHVDDVLQNLQEGTNQYTLIEPARLDRFIKQEKAALKSFHKKFKVNGFEKLTEETGDRKNLISASQDDFTSVLTRITTHLSNTEPQLYFSLCKKLANQNNDNVNSQEIRRFCSRLSWLKKLALSLRIS